VLTAWVNFKNYAKREHECWSALSDFRRLKDDVDRVVRVHALHIDQINDHAADLEQELTAFERTYAALSERGDQLMMENTKKKIKNKYAGELKRAATGNMVDVAVQHAV